MLSRRICSIIALLGVLLHAGAVVRHNVAVLDALSQYYDLLSDYAQICHGSGDASGVPGAELPSIPKPADSKGGCPICSGLASAFALAAPEPVLLGFVPLPAPPSLAWTVDVPPPRTFAPSPPARGPPTFA